MVCISSLVEICVLHMLLLVLYSPPASAAPASLQNASAELQRSFSGAGGGQSSTAQRPQRQMRQHTTRFVRVGGSSAYCCVFQAAVAAEWSQPWPTAATYSHQRQHQVCLLIFISRSTAAILAAVAMATFFRMANTPSLMLRV